MAVTTKYINEWKYWIMRGISSVKLKFANDTFYFIETLADSTEFHISTIDDDNDVGAKSPVAIKIEGSITIMQNNFKNYNTLFKDMTKEELIGVWIELEDPEGNNFMGLNGTPPAGDPTRALKVETYNITHHEINANTPSAKLRIDIVGYLSLEVYDTYLSSFFSSPS